MHQELIVMKKAEQVLYKIYPRLVNFPKSEKHSMCLHIKEAFFGLLKHIALGNAVKSKRKAYLQEADGHLQLLKVLVKLCNHRKYISTGFFNELDMDLTEINKLLSGYIRSAA